MKRRDFLKASLIGPLIASCGGDTGVSPTPTPAPTPAPPPQPPQSGSVA
jgi:hypothetical protein